MDNMLKVLLLPLIVLALNAADRGTALFDGKTLKGWHVSAKPADRDKGFWKVENGLVTCDSRGRADHNYVWLMTDNEYADFDLTLKIRSFRESAGNSGVQVRSRYDEAAGWLDGPQIDVNPPAAWRTGLIYDETREVKRWIFPVTKDWRIDESSAPKQWKWKHSDEGDGWNDLRVVCRGTSIKTWVNRLPAADFKGEGVLDDEAPRKHNVGLKGHIALQLHIKDDLYIQYKDIVVRTLR
jgi:hypothetical protein